MIIYLCVVVGIFLCGAFLLDDFCNCKFQIQLYVVSKNSYNLQLCIQLYVFSTEVHQLQFPPYTQLAIRFSKWKAKYFCPVENFLKRVVVYLRRAQKIRTTKRRAFHDENGLQPHRLQRPIRRMEKTHTPDTPHNRRCGSFCRRRLGIYRGLV